MDIFPKRKTVITLYMLLVQALLEGRIDEINEPTLNFNMNIFAKKEAKKFIYKLYLAKYKKTLDWIFTTL